jgi:hypothetical protein
MEGVTWVEVLDAHGAVAARARLERLPFVIGRGYGGDLVVDDPQVCSAHLRVAAGSDDTVIAEDLDSVNGLWTASGERVRQVRLRSGDTLRVGRTVLRFLGPDHPVPPAQPVASARRAPAGFAGGRVAAILAAAAIAVVTLQGYLGSYERTDPGTQIGEAAGYALLIAGYAGVWSFIGRATVHRFSFGAHVSIAAAGVLAFAGLTMASEYLAFLFPDSDAIEVLVGIGMLALAMALLYWHLEYATAFRARARLAIGTAVVGGIVLLMLAGEWEEEFSSYPEFSAVVKPVGVGLVQRTSAADFVAGADDLAAEVDSLAVAPVR